MVVLVFKVKDDRLDDQWLAEFLALQADRVERDLADVIGNTIHIRDAKGEFLISCELSQIYRSEV